MVKDCFINVFEENELREVLKLWLLPAIPGSLDRRITHSFWNSKLCLRFASPQTRSANQEIVMKRCNVYQEEFEDKSSLCPVDGNSLSRIGAALVTKDPCPDSGAPLAGDRAHPSEHWAHVRREFNVTMMDSAGLPARLATEVCFVVRQLKQVWPDLRRDPLGTVRETLSELTNWLKRFSLAPNTLAGAVTALIIVLCVVLTVILLEAGPKPYDVADYYLQDPVQIVAIKLADQSNPITGLGVGVGSEGRVGFDRGKREGSAPEPKKARGGGSGGMRDQSPTQQGRPPQPSEIPAPIPKFSAANNPTLPLAGIDIDPALWKKLPLSEYGDPRSKSPVSSNGPGDGGGMGTINGLGVGEGNGPGFGPGEKGNIGGDQRSFGSGGSAGGSGNNPQRDDHIFTQPQVEQRARILSKPEPPYTEEARKNLITGTVVLRVVFSNSGEVTNIRAIQPLPMGLTEKAIAAARRIRFLPATRNGHPVSVYVQLEYSFNLY